MFLLKRLVFIASFLFVCTYSAVSLAAGSPEVLLAKMANAGFQFNYSGTFTYEDGGGSVEVLGIEHAVENGRQIETIRHLSGPVREHNLSAQTSQCNPVVSRLLTVTGDGMLQASPHYSYSLRGKNRIAGREVDIIRVLPKDEFRYGLTLGLDSQTGLLLLAVVMSPKKLLERVQFTSLAVNSMVPEDAISSAESSARAPCPGARTSQAPLAPQWLPKGFELVAYSYSPETGHIETYSDGLASFSVTVQSKRGGSQGALQGEAVRGATIIKLALVAVENAPVQVTVIGEVPAATASRVLMSIRPVKQR